MRLARCYQAQTAEGFTVYELLVTLGLFAVLLQIAVSNLKALDNPLNNGTSELVSFFKLARQTAIATTSAYTLTATSSTHITAAFAANCSDTTMTLDPNLVLDLPDGAWLVDQSWIVCFSPRGLSDANPEVVIQNAEGLQRTVKVYLGGGIRVT